MSDITSETTEHYPTNDHGMWCATCNWYRTYGRDTRAPRDQFPTWDPEDES